ncbi:hypothetical protein ES288_A01G052600v1 [Gossypium darwinii]|nr:hypothetical protein ES288_A01G052600v1 [Gossypium darwinii]
MVWGLSLGFIIRKLKQHLDFTERNLEIYDVAIESPLQLATKLSERLGNQVWLKREDLQPVFSFKLRGAYNMMAKLTNEQLEKGVICSSAGNHAQGVALAARKLGCNAVIAMPVTTPEIKWQSVERLGATVVLVGDSYDEAQAYAKKRAKEESVPLYPLLIIQTLSWDKVLLEWRLCAKCKAHCMQSLFPLVVVGS